MNGGLKRCVQDSLKTPLRNFYSELESFDSKNITNSMNITTINYNLIDQYKTHLIKREIPHTYSISGQTERLKWGKKNSVVFTPEMLSLDDLAFIRKVKSSSSKLKVSAPRRKNIRYIGISEHLVNGYYDTGALEIDLNKAYWLLARKNGYITNEVFEQGLNMSKVRKGLRLIALGSLAATKTNFRYDFQKKEYIIYGKPETNPKTRAFFMDVCYQLGCLMMEGCRVVGHKNMHLFWVDAFITRNQLPHEKVGNNNLIEWLQSKGWNLTVEQIEYIKVIKYKAYIKTVGEEVRKFNLPGFCKNRLMDTVSRSAAQMGINKVRLDFSRFVDKSKKHYIANGRQVDMFR